MLITFQCDAYEQVTLFGDIASQFLMIMGESGIVPGAMLASDVPFALSRLKAFVTKEEKPLKRQSSGLEDEDEEPAVSLAHRALPLIKLLTAAEQASVAVMWA